MSASASLSSPGRGSAAVKAEPPVDPRPATTLALSFFVGGMTCASCAQRLSRALQEKVPGVQSARVSFLSQQADVVVCAQENAAVAAAVMDCVIAMGYTVLGSEAPGVAAVAGAASAPLSREGVRLTESRALLGGMDALTGSDDAADDENDDDAAAPTAGGGGCCGGGGGATPAAAAAEERVRTLLIVEGMSCGSCAARIENELKRIEGVEEASVNFAVMSATVVHDPTEVAAAHIVEAIQQLGYTPTLRSTTAITSGSAAAAATAAAPAAAGVAPSRGGYHSSTNSGISIVLAENTEERRHRRQQRRHREGNAAAGAEGSGTGATYVHRFLVEGMSCASCAARIEAAIRRLPVVTETTVSFTTGAAVAKTTGDSFLDDNEALEKLISSMGYTVTPLQGGGGAGAGGQANYGSTAAEGGGGDAVAMEDTDLARTRAALERKQEIEKQWNNFVNSALLSVPLVLAMILMAATDLMMTNRTVAIVVDGVQLICTTPIVFIFGRQFFVGAWRSFKHGAYTMDTLVAIGTGCSYVYSVVAYLATLLTGLHLMAYFDTAGMLTAFMLLGRYLEANAKRTTSGALIELMSLVPPMATVVTPDGDIRVASSALAVGNHVRVLAGDRIPVDGTIAEGQSDIDEQLVTGESVPKSCNPGDRVVGGTLNITASLVIVVDKVGEDTLLSQILRIVQEAQNTKPAVQRVADKLAMYFVPFVVATSLLTLAAWLVLGMMDAYPASWRPHGVPAEAFAFNFFIATVVAACPCALGLATPTAIMVGTGVGAKNGVLVKSGVTLESVRRANCMVFDKTGTITNGKLRVTWSQGFHIAAGAATQLARQLVGAVEAQSTHPIAVAVAAELLGDGHEAQAEVLRAVTHPGRGVDATVSVTETRPDGQFVHEYRVLVGNLLLMEEQQVPVSQEVREAVRQRNTQGQTTVVGAVDGEAVLVVALADEPKEEAFGVIEFLHRQKVRTLMVTGDNAHVAASIARTVGISFDNVRAEALPATKAEIVKQLQQEGYRVMFVGDGINDSPALAQADVGVALGAGTEVAIEAADAVLMRNSLVDLLSLRSLSDTTVRRIYGNFFWAFGYNMIMLPLASGMLFPFLRMQLPPVVAGAAMVMSSLSVLTSSLTIRCFKPFKQEEFVRTTW